MIARFCPSLNLREIFAALKFWETDCVERFEEHFANKFDQKYGVAFPYGRIGLFYILKALGFQGKEIICPAYTCVVVAHAIVKSGNIPIFVDCAEGDFNMNLEAVEAKISANTGAIIATSIFGYPVDLDKLSDITQKHPDVAIVQDCAHSFGARWQGHLVNKGGIAAFYGLNVSKLITSIFGGMVTTDDQILAERLRKLRDSELQDASFLKNIKRLAYLCAVRIAFIPIIYRFVNVLDRKGVLNAFTKYYQDDTIDLPNDSFVKLSAVEARVGLVQLEKYDEIVARRRHAANCYHKALAGHPSLKLPPLVQGATYSHYVVEHEQRDLVAEKCLPDGVQLGILIEYSVPLLKAYGPFARGDSFAISGDLAKRSLNLPVTIDAASTKKVIAALQASTIS